MTLQPVAVITGASSGIGAALARVFAANGHAVVLVARREAALAALADEIGRSTARPPIIPLDLARVDTPVRLAHELGARGLEAAYVVNNAGFGLIGRAAELDRAAQLSMIDVNARALTDLSLRFIDSLARHRGGILNVASVASFLPGPGMAVYHATKAYVLSLSEALHIELEPLGIRVTALCPGPVLTEFHPRAGVDTTRIPRLLTCTAESVAQQGYDGLMRGKRIVVPGWGTRFLRVLARVSPRPLLLASVDGGMKRRQAKPQPLWHRRG
jgi:short-subunit dehydrogenase